MHDGGGGHLGLRLHRTTSSHGEGFVAVDLNAWYLLYCLMTQSTPQKIGILGRIFLPIFAHSFALQSGEASEYRDIHRARPSKDEFSEFASACEVTLASASVRKMSS